MSWIMRWRSGETVVVLIGNSCLERGCYPLDPQDRRPSNLSVTLLAVLILDAPHQRAVTRATSCFGTNCPFAALRRFRQVSEGLLPSLERMRCGATRRQVSVGHADVISPRRARELL